MIRLSETKKKSRTQVTVSNDSEVIYDGLKNIACTE